MGVCLICPDANSYPDLLVCSLGPGAAGSNCDSRRAARASFTKRITDATDPAVAFLGDAGSESLFSGVDAGSGKVKATAATTAAVQMFALNPASAAATVT